MVSGLAYNTPDSCIGLAVTVILAPADAAIPSPVGPRIVDLLGFRAFRGSVSSEKVADLLAGLRSGCVPANVLPQGVDHELTLRRRDGHPLAYLHPRFEERHKGPLEYPYPHYRLEGHADNIGDWVPSGALGALSDALPSAGEPYPDLASLASDLQLGMVPEERTSRTINIISPIWIGWTSVETDIADGLVKLKLHSLWSDIGDELVVSMFPRSSEGASWRKRSVVGSEEWTVSDESGVRTFEAVLRATGPVPAADLILSFGSKPLDKVPVGLGSLRVIAHAMFDDGFQLLQKRLSSARSNTNNFEEGVAWLLHLCGFASVRYGHKDVQGATDVVAFRDESVVVFAECTAKIPPFQKVVDLRNRADAFQRRVRDSHGRSVLLLRAMFVDVPRQDISDDLVQRAHEDKVVFVTQDDMNRLLEAAATGESALHAWAIMANCGPKFGSIHLD